MSNELSILIETLQKKEDVLRLILEKSKEQLEIVEADEFDEQAFDNCFNDKDSLLEEMNRLDEGFDGVYNRIKVELKANLDDYKPQVASLQQLIRSTMDIGSEIHLTENKVKDALPAALSERKKNLLDKRVTANNVASYYRASKMMSVQDSYFMDHKQ